MFLIKCPNRCHSFRSQTGKFPFGQWSFKIDRFWYCIKNTRRHDKCDERCDYWDMELHESRVYKKWKFKFPRTQSELNC